MDLSARYHADVRSVTHSIDAKVNDFEEFIRRALDDLHQKAGQVSGNLQSFGGAFDKL